MEAALLDVRRGKRLLIQKEGRHKSVSKKRGISEDLQNLSLEELEESNIDMNEKTLQTTMDTGQSVAKNTRYAALKEKQKGMKGRLEQFKKEKEIKKQTEAKKLKDKFVVKHVRTPKASYLVSGHSRIKKDIPFEDKTLNLPPTEKVQPAKSRNKQIGKQALPTRLLRSQAMLGEAKKSNVPSYKEWKRKQNEMKKDIVEVKPKISRPIKNKDTSSTKSQQNKKDTSMNSTRQTGKSSTITTKKETAKNSKGPQIPKPELTDSKSDFVFKDGLDFLNFNFGGGKPETSQAHYFASVKKDSVTSLSPGVITSPSADIENCMDISIGESNSPCKLKLDFEEEEATKNVDVNHQNTELNPSDEVLMEEITKQKQFSPETTVTQPDSRKSELFPFKEIGTPSAISKEAQKVLSNVRTPIVAKKSSCMVETNPRTPVQFVKDMSLAPRLSLTPKNFLSKLEDPIASKIETPPFSDNPPSKEEEVKVENLPVTPEDIAVTVKHFTGLVDGETKKFEEYIQQWEKILEEKSAPEEVHGNILAGIGQAQLLIRKRFKQFRELVKLHKDTGAEKAAHASDLDGFWEMVYIQVDDIHKRFAELQKLKESGWKDENTPPIPIPDPKKSKPSIAKKKPAPTQSKTSKKGNQRSSALRKFLAEKKAAQKSSIEEIDVIIKTPSKTPLKMSQSPMDGGKTTTPLKEIQQQQQETPMAGDFSQYLTSHVPTETPSIEKPVSNNVSLLMDTPQQPPCTTQNVLTNQKTPQAAPDLLMFFSP